jgi:ParB/RepB/Spo0J family partition protein
MSSPIHAAFNFEGITVPISSLQPIRQIKSADSAFGKYRSILASIREVGVIEPLIVFPQKDTPGKYFLMDGHMRLKALQELGRTEVFCLIARDDDAFTFNEKVNRLSVIQEHAMIVRAIEHGVTPEQIAKALDLDLSRIKKRVTLLDGLEPRAIEILKNKPISAEALGLFRKVKPERQVDMAQLMVSGDNFTRAYAEALIIGTPPEQMVDAGKPKEVKGVTPGEIARMEKEMESLEKDYRVHQERFGENSLHLNAAQRYVKRLLENAKVKRFLKNRYPELLEEFEEIGALETI